MCAPAKLKCDMFDTCEIEVGMIDVKGFVYCNAHGQGRKRYCRARKLRPAELRKLERGETISYRR